MSNGQEGLGCFYGIGVGPGDPGLLTLKAHRLIQQMAVLCVPVARLGEESYALSIVRAFIDPVRQEVLPLLFPMTRQEDELQGHWQEAAAAIAARLVEGRDCAFLTEGDPLLYSTFIYMLDRLRQRYPNLPVEVVPGISSVNAAAAAAQVPLAWGDERVAILPATSENVEDALRAFDTIVLLKVNRSFDAILPILERLGLAERAVLVQRATTDRQSVVHDLPSLRGQRLDYFSLLIVRK